MEKQQNKAGIATKVKVQITKKVANVLILTGTNLAFFDAIDLCECCETCENIWYSKDLRV